MRVEWHLSKEKKEQLEKMKSPKKNKREKKSAETSTKKKQERLSEREWREIRGEFKQTLHRKRGGAWG